MNDFYVMLNSRHSSNTYFRNRPSSFKVKLNKKLRLEGGGLKVALCQYKSNIPPGFFVCSNICTSTIVGESQYNVLRHVSHSGENDYRPLYIPVSLGVVDYIHIYLIDELTQQCIDSDHCTTIDESTDQCTDSDKGTTFVTLHFIHKTNNP